MMPSIVYSNTLHRLDAQMMCMMIMKESPTPLALQSGVDKLILVYKSPDTYIPHSYYINTLFAAVKGLEVLK